MSVVLLLSSVVPVLWSATLPAPSFGSPTPSRSSDQMALPDRSILTDSEHAGAPTLPAHVLSEWPRRVQGYGYDSSSGRMEWKSAHSP